jgi:hypothetical protein
MSVDYFSHTIITMTSVQIRTEGGKVVIIDADAQDIVHNCRVYLNPGGYAKIRKDKKTHTLSRLIMDAPEGSYVSHFNGDILDHRRENLRVGDAFLKGNNRCMYYNNTSGYNGVFDKPRSHQWCVQWWTENKQHSKHFVYSQNDGIYRRYTRDSKEEAKQKAIDFRKNLDIQRGCMNGIRPKRARN